MNYFVPFLVFERTLVPPLLQHTSVYHPNSLLRAQGLLERRGAFLFAKHVPLHLTKRLHPVTGKNVCAFLVIYTW